MARHLRTSITMFTLRFLLLWGLTALTACAQGVLDAHPEITAAPVVHELAKRDGGFIGANMVGVNQCTCWSLPLHPPREAPC